MAIAKPFMAISFYAISKLKQTMAIVVLTMPVTGICHAP